MSHQRPRQPGVRAVRPRSIGGSRLTFRLAVVALLSASVLGLGGPGTALAASGHAAPAAAPVVEQASTPTPKGLTGEVYGFLPYWEIDSSVDAYLRYDLLTTIALFAVYYDAAGNLNTTTLLGSGRAALISTVVQHAHAQGVRVDLTLRPSTDTANANQTFFANAPAQAAAIANMAAQVASLGLDGANIDVESLYGTDFPAYGAFGAALRAALVKTHAGARVTVSTNANVSGSGMAAQAISQGVDRAFLMGYNYRGAGTSPVGSISPLVSSVGGLSLSWSIGQYDKLHVPRNRIILGLPYYGMTWPTTSGTLHATRSGSGVAFFPTDSLPPPAGTVIHYDAVESSAWYAVQDPTTKAWSETYFDDETSLRAKYGLAVSDGLAGVGMWALGYDAGQPGYWEADRVDVRRAAPRRRRPLRDRRGRLVQPPATRRRHRHRGQRAGLRRRARRDRRGRPPWWIAATDHADVPADECGQRAGAGGPGQGHRAGRQGRRLGRRPRRDPGQAAERRR